MNSDITDLITRFLTDDEFAAIRTFQSNWGYVGNHQIGYDLGDMLADTTTPTETLIERFMRKWDLNGPYYGGVRKEVSNLFNLRTSILTPSFTPNEVETLKSLPGEKSDETLRKELFREEADKRVNRYFIGKTGWAWFVHFIVDMPEDYKNSSRRISSLIQAKDGMTVLHMTSLYMSGENAWDAINADIRFVASYDDNAITHVVELDKM